MEKNLVTFHFTNLYFQWPIPNFPFNCPKVDELPFCVRLFLLIIVKSVYQVKLVNNLDLYIVIYALKLKSETNNIERLDWNNPFEYNVTEATCWFL